MNAPAIKASDAAAAARRESIPSNSWFMRLIGNIATLVRVVAILSYRPACLVVLAGVLCVVSGAGAQVLIRQPADVTDVRSLSYVNTGPPKGSVGVTLWGAHYRLQPTEDRTLADDTGFAPPDPRRDHQLSVAPLSPGATAIQAYGGEIGINIQSASIAANLADRFDLGTIVLGADLAAPARPFAVGMKAKYSFAAKIPRSRQSGRGVSQVVAYYSLRDRVHRQSFWYGMVVFDSRGWFHQRSGGFEQAMWDQGTNQPIVHATADHPGRLLDRGYPTASFGWRPFPDRRFYAFVIGAPQVRAAVSTMKAKYPELAAKFSDDPADYEIRHINLNPEVHAPAGSFAQVGMSVTDWQLEIVP
jgi:hypothetical protein